MKPLLDWIVSHPELVGWALLSTVGALWPESRMGQLARRWASDLRGPGKHGCAELKGAELRESTVIVSDPEAKP